MVEDQFSGQSGECVICGRPVQLPRFASTSAERTDKHSAGIRLAAGAATAALVVLAVIFVAIRFGGQGIQTLRQNRLRGQCIQNVEKIALALNNYARDYGTYPPPTTFAADGTTPKHSWRVLILPYLGYQNLYDRYRMDVAWDALENQDVLFEIPVEYQSPAAIQVSGVEANYFLVTGPGTLFPKSGPLGPNGVLDSRQKTLLVVQAEGGPLMTSQWTEPGDFDITNTAMTIGVDIGGSHDGGATAATVDGMGHFLRDTLDPGVVKALITPAGGEGLADDVLD
jgi:hypothetical protein